MKDFRFITQAVNSLGKIPPDRRELAIQYVWQSIRPEAVEAAPAPVAAPVAVVAPPPVATTNEVRSPPPAQTGLPVALQTTA